MGGAVLNIGGLAKPVRFSFVQPQNTKFPYHKIDNSLIQLMSINEGISDLKAGREFGNKLKTILGK